MSAERNAPSATRSMVGAETRLPVQDLNRARAWYADKLRLHPVEERPGGLRYQLGTGVFCLFDSAGCSAGSFTQVALEVEDIETTVQTLLGRGVHFDRGDGRDGPAIQLADIIIDIDNNYPSKGNGERGAFFRDSENNMVSLGQSIH